MSLNEEKLLPPPLDDFAHQIDEIFVIGAKVNSEVDPSDYVNHSCDPTCGFKGQIVLKTMRLVEAGEAITFDYGTCLYGSAANGLDYAFDCSCGARNCRGKITSSDWTDVAFQRRFNGWMQPFLEEIIRVSSPEIPSL